MFNVKLSNQKITLKHLNVRCFLVGEIRAEAEGHCQALKGLYLCTCQLLSHLLVMNSIEQSPW